MEDTKGSIVASETVDDVLQLGLWCNRALPRLVIQNRISGTKRMSPLSWLEKESRKLTMKGENGMTHDFTSEDLVPSVRKLLAAFIARPVFKALLWRTTILLSDAIHTPKPIFDPGELSLLPETKRCTLWIADLTQSQGKGVFRPYFPMTDEECGALPDPPHLSITNGKGATHLKATGVTRRLVVANPSRWYRPILLASGALLCGFSVNFEDLSETAATLWGMVQEGQIRGRDLVLAAGNPETDRMIRHIVVYTRHLSFLGDISQSFLRDGYDVLRERGYVRTRRIPFSEGALGPVEYKVTLCSREEDGRFAVVAVPEKLTNRHDGDIVLEMPSETYERICDADSFGGARDEYDSIANLFSAMSFSRWIASVGRFLEGMLPSLV